MEKLYSVKEAAEIIGVTPKTLRAWQKEGKVEPITTVGGHRRYTEEIINECLIRKPSLKKVKYYFEKGIEMATALNVRGVDELRKAISGIDYGYSRD